MTQDEKLIQLETLEKGNKELESRIETTIDTYNLDQMDGVGYKLRVLLSGSNMDAWMLHDKHENQSLDGIEDYAAQLARREEEYTELLQQLAETAPETETTPAESAAEKENVAEEVVNQEGSGDQSVESPEQPTPTEEQMTQDERLATLEALEETAQDLYSRIEKTKDQYDINPFETTKDEADNIDLTFKLGDLLHSLHIDMWALENDRVNSSETPLKANDLKEHASSLADVEEKYTALLKEFTEKTNTENN